jgi:hypothetical protein
MYGTKKVLIGFYKFKANKSAILKCTVINNHDRKAFTYSPSLRLAIRAGEIKGLYHLKTISPRVNCPTT